MRVLHVIATGQRRGAEIFASDLVRALDDMGVAQRVAVIRGSGSVAVQFDAPVSVLPSNGLALPGLRVRLRTLRAIARLIRTWVPDVVQAHGGEALKYAVVASVGTSTSIVYRRIGTAPTWLLNGPRRVAYGRLMGRAARVVAVAEAVRREAMESFRIPEARIVTIPNGVDLERLEPTRTRDDVRTDLGISRDAPVILSLGALTWEKDPLAQLEITRQVLAERHDIVHVVVGDGPMRETVRHAVRDLDGSVLMLGARDDVPDLLAASDVLLFASRSDGMEGMPASLIEAGVAGVPVAAYAVAGVEEIVTDGTTGLLARPGDQGGLARRIVDLLADGERRSTIGEAARERCRARFDIRVVAPRYLSVYEEVSAS